MCTCDTSADYHPIQPTSMSGILESWNPGILGLSISRANLAGTTALDRRRAVAAALQPVCRLTIILQSDDSAR